MNHLRGWVIVEDDDHAFVIHRQRVQAVMWDAYAFVITVWQEGFHRHIDIAIDRIEDELTEEQRAECERVLDQMKNDIVGPAFPVIHVAVLPDRGPQRQYDCIANVRWTYQPDKTWKRETNRG